MPAENVIRTIEPNKQEFDLDSKPAPLLIEYHDMYEVLQEGDIKVEMSPQNMSNETTWAVAPIHDAANRLVGGLFGLPINQYH